MSGPARSGGKGQTFETRPERERAVLVSAVFGSDWVRFVCECQSDECQEVLHVTLDEYARVRAHARWFLLVPGHEAPPRDRVVERHEHYVIVEATRPE